MTDTRISAATNTAPLLADSLPLARVADTTARRVTIGALRQGVYNVADYGAVGNGVTDDSAPVIAAIAAAQAASGGVIYFPPGTYRINSQLALPNDGQAVPEQKPIRLTGSVAGSSGNGRHPNGGSILDLRYSGAGVAKIDTRGTGLLEIDHLTIKDDGNDTVPYIQTTNTTLWVHHCRFHGNPGKSGGTCDQDVLILGGTGTDLDGSANACFQGYGTVIENNYFNRIQRGVYGRTYCNSVVVRDNNWWNACGGTCAIEFLGINTNSDVGNIITGNLIEVVSYIYGIKMAYATANQVGPNGFYDGDPTAYIYFGVSAAFNTVIGGFYEISPLIEEHASVANKNMVLTAHQAANTVFPGPVLFHTPWTLLNNIGPTLQHATNAYSWHTQLFNDTLAWMFHTAAGAEQNTFSLTRNDANTATATLEGALANRLKARTGNLSLLVDEAGATVALGEAIKQVTVIDGSLHCGAAWNGQRVYLGAYQFWVDSSGRLRIKAGDPVSDTDGTIVGSQS